MLKTLRSGLILLLMFSCGTIIKEPQPVYVINSKFASVAYGIKTFNHYDGVNKMAEWTTKPKMIKWKDMPENIIGFPLEIWLTKIKPVLKELARKSHDASD